MNMGVEPPFKITFHSWETLSIVETRSSISPLKEAKSGQLYYLFPPLSHMAAQPLWWAVSRWLTWMYSKYWGNGAKTVGLSGGINLSVSCSGGQQRNILCPYLLLHFHSISRSVGSPSLPSVMWAHSLLGQTMVCFSKLGTLPGGKYTAFILFSESFGRNQAADYTC